MSHPKLSRLVGFHGDLQRMLSGCDSTAAVTRMGQVDSRSKRTHRAVPRGLLRPLLLPAFLEKLTAFGQKPSCGLKYVQHAVWIVGCLDAQLALRPAELRLRSLLLVRHHLILHPIRPGTPW